MAICSAITSFTGEYRWASNFGPGEVLLGTLVYPRREHAFQAHKELDPEARKFYANPDLSAGDAKRAGQRADLRADWERVRKRVMLRVVLAAFTQNDELARLLVATQDAVLIEGNHWHDNYWGACTCRRCGEGDYNNGQNYLGRILMMVRDIVRVD